jgi:hypothetical protein
MSELRSDEGVSPGFRLVGGAAALCIVGVVAAVFFLTGSPEARDDDEARAKAEAVLNGESAPWKKPAQIGSEVDARDVDAANLAPEIPSGEALLPTTTQIFKDVAEEKDWLEKRLKREQQTLLEIKLGSEFDQDRKEGSARVKAIEAKLASM